MDIGFYMYVYIPSTTKTIFFVGYLYFLYRAFYSKPTKIMVMVDNGLYRYRDSVMWALLKFLACPVSGRLQVEL